MLAAGDHADDDGFGKEWDFPAFRALKSIDQPIVAAVTIPTNKHYLCVYKCV